MEKDKRIYFKELVRCILLKWKTIIITMLICGFIANIGGCIISYKKAEAELTKVSDKTDVSIYTIDMSEEDIEDTEKTAKLYFKDLEVYERGIEYCNNSIKMNLDPDKVLVGTLQYKINNCKDVDGLINVLESKLKSDEVCQMLIDATRLDTQKKYIKELIQVSNLSNDTSSEISNNIIEDKASDKKNGVMLVQVMAPTDNVMKNMVDALEKILQDKAKGLTISFDQFEFAQIDCIYSEGDDEELRSYQQKYMTDLYNLGITLEGIKNSISADKQEYFNALVENYKGKEIIKNEDKQSEKIQIDYINIKYIFLGLILGLLGACVVIICPCIFGDRLQTAEELTDYFDVSILGKYIEDENKKSKTEILVDKILDKNKIKLTKQDNLEVICNQILLAINKYNIRHLHIIRDTNVLNEEFENEFIQRMNDKCEYITFGNSVLEDPNSLKELISTDGVIMLSSLKNLNLSHCEKEIELIKKYDVEIIGAVIVE